MWFELVGGGLWVVLVGKWLVVMVVLEVVYVDLEWWLFVDLMWVYLFGDWYIVMMVLVCGVDLIDIVNVLNVVLFSDDEMVFL